MNTFLQTNPKTEHNSGLKTGTSSIIYAATLPLPVVAAFFLPVPMTCRGTDEMLSTINKSCFYCLATQSAGKVEREGG